MESKIQTLNEVQFPENTGERIYMLPFRKDQPLPAQYARWQNTVDQMVASIDTNETMYLMVDQGRVKAGHSHRRGGVHIDGNWLPEIHAHRGDGGGGRHRVRRVDMVPEALILASDSYGCDAYLGEWDGKIGEGGDCSHLDLSPLERVPLRANVGYVGNVWMLHESVPVRQDTLRTVVRINVPNYDF